MFNILQNVLIFSYISLEILPNFVNALLSFLGPGIKWFLERISAHHIHDWVWSDVNLDFGHGLWWIVNHCRWPIDILGVFVLPKSKHFFAGCSCSCSGGATSSRILWRACLLSSKLKFFRGSPCLSVSHRASTLALINPEIRCGSISSWFHLNLGKPQPGATWVMLECLNANWLLGHMNYLLGDIMVGLWLEQIWHILSYVFFVLDFLRLELKFLGALHVSVHFRGLLYLLVVGVVNILDLYLRHAVLLVVVSLLRHCLYLFSASISLRVK